MQQITIFESKGAKVTEVKDVTAFSDKEIKLVVGGRSRRLFLVGSGLKITDFSKEKGELTIEGDVSEMRYVGAKENFLKRIFK